MAKEKACKKCKLIHDKGVCPQCGYEESTTTLYGKLVVLNSENSELAKTLGHKQKGEYAIRTG